MYDGTPVTTPSDLSSLLKRPIPLVRSFTENLMAYALGRRVETSINRPSARLQTGRGGQLSHFSVVLAVVKSNAFRSKRADP
jgi:hypothetical protein